MGRELFIIVVIMNNRLTMGYIKMHRDIQEWEWYGEPKMVAFWLHLLINANWVTREWRGETIGRGQLVASVASLSLETGLSVKEVRTALSRLVKSKYIVTEGASQWTKITICNYDSYYIDDDAKGRTKGNQKANEGQAKGEQGATNKEYKERQEDKEEKKTSNDVKEKRDAAERLYQLYPASVVRTDGNRVSLKSSKDKERIIRLLADHTEEELADTIRQYLAENHGSYTKMFSTFLNNLPDYSSTPSVFDQPQEEERRWPGGIKPQEV